MKTTQLKARGSEDGQKGEKRALEEMARKKGGRGRHEAEVVQLSRRNVSVDHEIELLRFLSIGE